jgi:type VI secretion system protein ImpA
MNQDKSVPSLSNFLDDLSEEAPAGHDLRLDISPQSRYFLLRDARSEARAQERAADNDPTADTGIRHWGVVRGLAIAALIEDTKDIEIASWLTESLVRLDGLPGLILGAGLLRGLVERFWERGLFPAQDEDGIEGRLAPIAGLDGEGGNGALLQPLRKLVLFEREDGTPVAFWQFEQSEELSTVVPDPNRKTPRRDTGIPPLADLERAARGVGKPMLTTIAGRLALAIEAWNALAPALDAVAGRDAPSLGRVRDLLAKQQRIVARYADPLPAAAPAAAAVETETETSAAGQPAALPPPVAAIPDREALLDEISRIAALFRKNEPNSPISFTLDEAVRRARLGLPELLKEMMPEAAQRTALLTGLGIRPGSE